jgi:hypothetical protein
LLENDEQPVKLLDMEHDDEGEVEIEPHESFILNGKKVSQEFLGRLFYLIHISSFF